MSTRLVLSALAALAAVTLNAGTVNLLPMQPTAGSDLKIEYSPSTGDASWATKDAKIHAVALWFDVESQFPTAHDVPLAFDGKRYIGTYAIPTSAVYVMFKVGNGTHYDTNDEMFWSTLIYDANGRAVTASNLRASQTCLGMLPPECRRKQDLDEARDLLLQESRISPRLLTSQINLIMLESSIGVYSHEEAVARLQHLVSHTTVVTSSEEALSIASAFRAMGDSTEATRVMREASMKFPNGLVAEQVKLEKLSTASTLDDFTNLVIEHLRQYPTSHSRSGLIEAVLNATTRQGAYPTLIRFLDNVPHLPAVVYYQAVNYLGTQDSLRAETKRLIEAGLVATNDPKARLPFVGEAEWAAQQELSRSQIYFVKGAILRSEGQFDSAIVAFKESVKYGGVLTDKGVYEMLISTLDPKQHTNDVITYCEQSISSGAYTSAVVESYKVALAQQGKDAKAINEAVARQKSLGSAAMNARFQHEKLNQSMIDGMFTTLDGTAVKISDWKGKVVVIDYWATWCGPCKKSFPSLQKLYELYKDNPNVVFAIVNVWERSKDRVTTVKDFVKNNPSLTFPMYLDTNDAVVQKYGVTGIPTKFFLGKDGRIQFKEVGLSPEDQFIEESTKRIEVLLAE